MNKKYAYATLVGTDDFAWGAICLALSAKELAKIEYPFIIMVAEDCSENTKNLIKNLNFVIYQEVPAIKVGIKQDENFPEYCRYNCVSEKYFLFSMIDYDLILFLDADCLLKKSWDDIFDLIPGTCFSTIQIKSNNELCPAQLFFARPDLESYLALIKAYQENVNKGMVVLEEPLFYQVFKDTFPYEIKMKNLLLQDTSDDVFNLREWDHFPGMPKYWDAKCKNIYDMISARNFIEDYKIHGIHEYFDEIRNKFGNK